MTEIFCSSLLPRKSEYPKLGHDHFLPYIFQCIIHYDLIILSYIIWVLFKKPALSHSRNFHVHKSPPLKKFPAFYGTWTFITTFIRAHPWSKLKPCVIFSKKLFAPHPTPPSWRTTLCRLSDSYFSIFAATLHTQRPFPPSATRNVPRHSHKEPT
jgi:hypothetical protein